MRTMMMITILVLMATMVKSDENVVVNFLKAEKDKTIAYQTKVWSEQKVKNAQMWSKLKSLFKGKNDTQD